MFCFFTCSTAHSARHRYLIYSEADFEGFRPAVATRCTDGCEIWHGGFDQNVEYKRPTGAYPLRDFHKICRVCTPFQPALAVKISLVSLKGYGVMGVLS